MDLGILKKKKLEINNYQWATLFCQVSLVLYMERMLCVSTTIYAAVYVTATHFIFESTRLEMASYSQKNTVRLGYQGSSPSRRLGFQRLDFGGFLLGSGAWKASLTPFPTEWGFAVAQDFLSSWPSPAWVAAAEPKPLVPLSVDSWSSKRATDALGKGSHAPSSCRLMLWANISLALSGNLPTLSLTPTGAAGAGGCACAWTSAPPCPESSLLLMVKESRLLYFAFTVSLPCFLMTLILCWVHIHIGSIRVTMF